MASKTMRRSSMPPHLAATRASSSPVGHSPDTPPTPVRESPVALSSSSSDNKYSNIKMKYFQRLNVGPNSARRPSASTSYTEPSAALPHSVGHTYDPPHGHSSTSLAHHIHSREHQAQHRGVASPVQPETPTQALNIPLPPEKLKARNIAFTHVASLPSGTVPDHSPPAWPVPGPTYTNDHRHSRARSQSLHSPLSGDSSVEPLLVHTNSPPRHSPLPSPVALRTQTSYSSAEPVSSASAAAQHQRVHRFPSAQPLMSRQHSDPMAGHRSASSASPSLQPTRAASTGSAYSLSAVMQENGQSGAANVREHKSRSSSMNEESARASASAAYASHSHHSYRSEHSQYSSHSHHSNHSHDSSSAHPQQHRRNSSQSRTNGVAPAVRPSSQQGYASSSSASASASASASDHRRGSASGSQYSLSGQTAARGPAYAQTSLSSAYSAGPTTSLAGAAPAQQAHSYHASSLRYGAPSSSSLAAAPSSLPREATRSTRSMSLHVPSSSAAYAEPFSFEEEEDDHSYFAEPSPQHKPVKSFEDYFEPANSDRIISH